MNEATQWLAQWPIWVLAALLVSAVFHAGRLAQRVGGLEGRLEQGLARLETRMEALFGELRAELRENRAEVSKTQGSAGERGRRARESVRPRSAGRLRPPSPSRQGKR